MSTEGWSRRPKARRSDEEIEIVADPEISKRRLASLYDVDETMWLERTAHLLSQGKFNEIDSGNLVEFLEAMAENDRRKVESRLERLIEHILKWEHQPDKRGNSWRRTILEQQRALGRLLRSGSLRRYAERVWPDAYLGGRSLAAAATGLPPETFATECPWSLEEILTYLPTA